MAEEKKISHGARVFRTLLMLVFFAFGVAAIASSGYYLYSGNGWWMPLPPSDSKNGMTARGAGIFISHLIGMVMFIIACCNFNAFAASTPRRRGPSSPCWSAHEQRTGEREGERSERMKTRRKPWTNLEMLRAEVAGHMDDMLKLFKDGVKIAVVVFDPENAGRDFCLADDDLDGFIDALRRCKNREAQ
jgi:hypothetical protein